MNVKSRIDSVNKQFFSCTKQTRAMFHRYLKYTDAELIIPFYH